MTEPVKPYPELAKLGTMLSKRKRDKELIEKRMLSRRWKEKRIAIYDLQNNIDRLKRHVREDLQSENEKTKLTALVIRLMMNTSERIGNNESAGNGHYGITEFKLRHIKVQGDRIYLKYKGKSGVDHEKNFVDPAAAPVLKHLLERNKRYVFTTETGFRIIPARVNRYLKEYGITSKDIRGFNSNRMMLMRLTAVGKTEEKQRKKVFNENLRKVAAKIGHTAATLRKHYLLPEIEKSFYSTGEVSNIKLD